MNIVDIERVQKQLRRVVSNWHPDKGHTPPKYVRTNGMGETVAIVDPWCGGYQDVFKPTVIGWEARGPGFLMRSHHLESDIVMVAVGGDYKEAAINVACAEADKALIKLGWPASDLEQDAPTYELVKVEIEGGETQQQEVLG